jgi:hypothetical protein
MGPANTNQRVTINKQGLPVFFVALGSHVNFFFDKVLKQAVASNGYENVYVLADRNFTQYQDYNCIDVNKYMHGRSFDALYTHHSNNTYFFEKSCFDRWFIINDLVKDLGITYFFHADCDVLILENLQPVYAELQRDDFDGSTMYFSDGVQSITSGHSSFWSSGLLNNFCNFTCAKYQDKDAFATILADAQSGIFYGNTNVSDMILLDVFRREAKPNLINLLVPRDGACFDFNINASYNGREHQFAMRYIYGIKKIVQLHNGSFGAIKAEGKPQYMRFCTLHFQGYITKSLIPMHVTYGSGWDKIQNRVLAIRNFVVRKMKIKKNHIRDALKKLTKQ